MSPRFVVLVLLATVTLAACGSGSDPSPEAVVEAYLRAGSAENEAEIRANLDPACHTDQGMVRVDAVRMVGAPITIEELTVTAGATEGETATVAYDVAGPVHSAGGTQELFGVEVTTGEINIARATHSGSLTLRRVDDRWMVACP